MQRRAVVGGERSQHVVLDAGEQLLRGAQLAFAFGRYLDDVAAAIGSIATPGDEAAFLEFVQRCSRRNSTC
ncbi:MAG: hypothetical protein QOJ66_1421 [Ilumatobacteraceae bacterium]